MKRGKRLLVQRKCQWYVGRRKENSNIDSYRTVYSEKYFEISRRRTMKRPNLTPEEVASKLTALYSLEVDSIHRLDGYDDLNLFVECKPSLEGKQNKYVCKILNDEDSQHIPLIEAQHQMMFYLSLRNVCTPTPVLNNNSKQFSIEIFDNTEHVFLLLAYVEGNKLESRPSTAELYFNVGAFIARLSTTLKGFSNESLTARNFIWMLVNAPKILECLHVVPEGYQRDMARQVAEDFKNRVLPVMTQLESGPTHGDLNTNNILTKGDEISGLIDFGDICVAPYFFDVAICLCYMIMHSGEVSTGKDVLKGYQTCRPLTNLEIPLLKICVSARLTQSLVLGLFSALEAPGNDYILSTQKRGWKMLTELFEMNDEELITLWEI